MTDLKYPKGFAYRPGLTKFAVVFPEQLFKEITRMAKHERKSFNDMVIELVKVGKLDLEESDRLELAS